MRDLLDMIFLSVALIIGFAAGGCMTQAYCEKQAVKSGHAEYYLDENNNKQWRWK